MDRPRLIFLKRAVLGFATSVPAVAISYWALRTYVRSAPTVVVACAAAAATFYCMTLAMRAAVREAYQAGEVVRRLPSRRVDRDDHSVGLRPAGNSNSRKPSSQNATVREPVGAGAGTDD